MRAASGSTHHHAALHRSCEFRLAQQSHGHIRERAQRYDLNARIFVHRLNQRVHGMTGFGAPLRGPVPVIA